MDLELKNKKIFISGGSKGIGLAMVKSFLEEGANVSFIARNKDHLSKVSEDLSKKFGREQFLSIAADATSSKELNDAVREVYSHWGPIDIFISNVGDGRSVPDPIPSESRFLTTWSTNFTSAENLARLSSEFINKSSGTLLFISSITGIEALGAPTDYSVAKAALISLSKNLAKKLSPGIRVNCIAPGNILFEGGSWDEKIKVDPDRVNNMLNASVPMKRFGTPEEIANAALFVCSPKASFMTGSCIIIDGGQTSALH